MRNLTKLVLFLIAISLGGCYTQLAVRDYDHDSGYWNDNREDDSTYYDDSTYAADDSSGYYDRGYNDGYDNYYDDPYYGNYRRYYWGYYPSSTFTVGVGSWYDPFWYTWNSCYLCPPDYWYYPWYNRGYWGGYYGGFYDPYSYYYPPYYYGDHYKYRTKPSTRLRGNSGGGRGVRSEEHTS